MCANLFCLKQEGVLSRLQQNVTLEEQRWAQQLAEKQRELDDLRQRTVLQVFSGLYYASMLYVQTHKQSPYRRG